MAKSLIAASFWLFSVLCVATCNGITREAQQLQALQTELMNKDELIAMLKIKTISEQERIEELEKQLEQLKLQRRKCQSSSCLCQATGLHEVQLPPGKAFQVSCDSSLVDRGWTVILRRINGSVDFNRKWSDYQKGFGDLQGEFFIGLDRLQQLTQFEPHELYIYLKNWKDETRFARYDNFVIGGDSENYKIRSLGAYSGNAGDALAAHDQMMFSTHDQDNDQSDRNCADENSSGWWFNNCYKCNLNGPYNSGFFWYPWQRNVLKFAQVMIRPREN